VFDLTKERGQARLPNPETPKSFDPLRLKAILTEIRISTLINSW